MMDLKLTRAETEQRQACDHKKAADGNQDAGPILVEDRADLDPHEEHHKEVQAEDPADLRWGVARQLMRREPGLKDGRGIDDAKDAEHGAKGAEDD